MVHGVKGNSDGLEYQTIVIPSTDQLAISLKKTIKKTINEQIPVANLGYMTPVQYEEYLKTVPQPSRKTIKLYDFNEKKGDF